MYGGLNMTSINPAETQVQAPAFKGLKKGLKAIAEHKKEIEQLGERASKQNAIMERIAGATYAFQIKNPARLKETVMRENALGHFDFVKGINVYLARNASKDIYKN